MLTMYPAGCQHILSGTANCKLPAGYLSETQSSLTRRIRQGLNTPVILEATAVEDDLIDAGGLGSLGDQLAHRFGALSFGLANQRGAEHRVFSRRRDDSTVHAIVDYLGVDMDIAAKNAEPWALGRAGNPLAHP